MHNQPHKPKYKQQPINGQPNGLKIPSKRWFENVLLWIGGSILALVVIVIISAVVWYNIGLSPIGNDASQLKKIVIPSGSTSSQIGKKLEKAGVIRNATVFDIYVRLNCKNNILQAGSYRLSPAETVPRIVEHFVKGSVDTFSITFYPGATLVDNTDKATSKKLDITSVLKRAGYSDKEITSALTKTYMGPLFAGKPASANLEGYIYGDTYNFNAGATVDEILQRTFDKFYEEIKSNNLAAKFKNHGLNLYQGITLASIVQKEVNNPKDQTHPTSDQRQVAQVFYLRMKKGMTLGSDVTYQYIADKTGVARDPNLDSPYNTRRFTGLPPGPISSPSLSALLAVADPASGDYLYFLSGDDDVTYFARTDAEHQANITNHCKVKCATP